MSLAHYRYDSSNICISQRIDNAKRHDDISPVNLLPHYFIISIGQTKY